MYSRLVLFGLFVSSLSVVGKSNDDVNAHIRDHPLHHHIHQKSHINAERNSVHQSLRNHPGKFKTRQENGNTSYYIYVDEQLAAVAAWLNGTKELIFIYNILSSCISGASGGINNISAAPGTTFPSIFNNGTFPLPGTNITFPGNNVSVPFFGTNVTFPTPSTNGFYNASSNFPIFECWARHAANVIKLPEVANIWKDIFVGLNGGCNQADNIVKKITDFFGNNGTLKTLNFF